MDDITENIVVGYKHRDITAGLKQELQIHVYLLIQPHTYRCACKSVATDQLHMLVRCMLVECNFNQHVCCLIAEFKDLSASAGLLIW